MLERWTFHGPADNIHICLENDDNQRVCFMTSDGPTVERARLIAAAPDALEMAKTISYQYDNQDLNHVDFRVMAKQLADAFIAKATEPRPNG